MDDWIDKLAEEIASDPDCCDIQSSSSLAIGNRIRSAVRPLADAAVGSDGWCNYCSRDVVSGAHEPDCKTAAFPE